MTGSWVHLAATYTSAAGEARLYINGDLVKEETGAGSLSEDWDGRASFGIHKGTVSDAVYFDEILAYNRALSPFEVKNLFGKCNFGSSGGGKVVTKFEWLKCGKRNTQTLCFKRETTRKKCLRLNANGCRTYKQLSPLQRREHKQSYLNSTKMPNIAALSLVSLLS